LYFYIGVLLLLLLLTNKNTTREEIKSRRKSGNVASTGEESVVFQLAIQK